MEREILRRSPSSGLTLIELLITIGILGIATLAVVGSFKYIATSVQHSKGRTLSSNLAQEQIEKLKNLSYYSLLVTTSTCSPPDSRFDPPLLYDTGHYPPQEVIEGGMKFTRTTRVDFAYQNAAGDIVLAPWTSDDTSMKRITVYVIWREGGDWRHIEMHNMMANPAANPLNASFNGYVKTAVTHAPIPGALVQVIDNPSWYDYTDNTGFYQFNVSVGSYTLVASTAGFISATSPGYTFVNSGQTVGVDFSLTPILTGSAAGQVYRADHLLISQVVGSSRGPDGVFCQEFVELYNPTTSYVQMVMGLNIDLIALKAQRQGEASPTTIDVLFNVINASIPPNGYFLIANTGTVAAAGVARDADAVYNPNLFSNPQYPNIIRTAGGGCDPDTGDADGVGIAHAMSGEWIDRVGWRTNPGTPHSPPLLEGTPVWQNIGLEDGEQYIRATHPGGLITAGAGRAYDSDDNTHDFVATPLAHPPRNSLEAEPPQTGTPATGAIVSANDSLSAPALCSDVILAGGYRVCSFNLTPVATGAWTIDIASGTYFGQIENVAIGVGVATGVPNGSTLPAWPADGVTATVLRGTTEYAFVSGVVRNAASQPLANIKVTDNNGRHAFSASNGRYLLLASTGTIILTANPFDSAMNRAYVTQSRGAHLLELGQLYNEASWAPADTTDFNLALGGMVRGYFRTTSNTPLPGRVAVALRDGNEMAQAASDNSGYFYLSNLSTGTYEIRPALDPAEVSSPSSATVVLVSTGVTTNVSTFTIVSGLAQITGQVLSGGQPITTGVLILASTVTLTGGVTTPPPPVDGANGALCNPCMYAASSDAGGRYTLEVRSSPTVPYRVYGWYTTFMGQTPSVSRAGAYTVNVSSPGQIISQNLTW